MDQPFEHNWRGKAAFLVSKLNRAHTAVHGLGTTIDKGHARLARRRFRSVREQIASLSQEVNAMRAEPGAKDRTDEVAAEGAALAVRGSEAATAALDVMVDAMAVLDASHDDSDVDILVGACIDAERTYEDSVAIVQATSRAHGPAITHLRKAFDTDGEVALRERLRRKGRAVRAIRDRAVTETGPRGQQPVGVPPLIAR